MAEPAAAREPLARRVAAARAAAAPGQPAYPQVLAPAPRSGASLAAAAALRPVAAPAAEWAAARKPGEEPRAVAMVGTVEPD